MRNIILLITFFLIFSCKKSENNIEFEPSIVKDINDIVGTIIIEDSLDVFKKGDDSKMLCEKLIKLNIYIPEKAKSNENHPPPPPWYGVSINDLLHYNGEASFFNTKDSLHLLKQNLNSQNFKIDLNLANRIYFTSIEKENSKKERGKPYNFYQMTIPIFSLNNQIAYVELNHYCGSLCGSGKSIYLRKINGKWKVMNKWKTWVS